LVQLNVPSKLVDVLRTSSDVQTIRNSTGALANVSFVSDDLQAQLVDQGILPILMEQLNSEEDLVVVMSLRAIGNIVDDTTRSIFQEQNGMAKLMEIAFKHSAELARSDALTTSREMIENRDGDLLEFAQTDDWLPRLHTMAKTDEDEQVRLDAWTFLLTLSEQPDIKPLFTQRGILAALMQDVERLKDDPVPLASTLQVLGQLAAHDDSMDDIFNSFSAFFPLLEHEDESVKTYTAMIVGNIARRDEYCARLLQAGAVPVLKGLCKSTARIQHLVLGALRNIAIPEENKKAVADEEGLIEVVLECIATGNNAHVLYNSVIFLKVLAAGGESFVNQLVEKNTIATIAQLLDRELESGQERIHYEASRLIVAIALSNEANCTRTMEEKTGLRCISLLLSTSFDLLHKEALAGLKQVLSQGKFNDEVADSTVVQDLMRTISTSSSDVHSTGAEIVRMLITTGHPKILSALREDESRQALCNLPDSERQALVAQLDA